MIRFYSITALRIYSMKKIQISVKVIQKYYSIESIIYLENKRSKSGKLVNSERISCIKSGTFIREEIAFCLAIILGIVVNGLHNH